MDNFSSCGIVSAVTTWVREQIPVEMHYSQLIKWMIVYASHNNQTFKKLVLKHWLSSKILHSETLLSRTLLSQISVELDTFRDFYKSWHIQMLSWLLWGVINATITLFQNRGDYKSCQYAGTACHLIIFYPDFILCPTVTQHLLSLPNFDFVYYGF